MHQSMHRQQCGDLIFYTCDRLPVRHAFTTKAGGVSQGDCKSLNLGFSRGDLKQNVYQNYEILTQALQIPLERTTLTKQVHQSTVTIVDQAQVGAGLHRPQIETDGLVTALPQTPIAGFYADCVVTLFYDPTAHVCGVCHAGWRGTAQQIAAHTVEKMAQLGANRKTILAVIGPSICQDCFETDQDVPDAMRAQMGEVVEPLIEKRGKKFHINLQGAQRVTLERAGLQPENIIDSGLCTRCLSHEFWSHRATNGRRGVQAGVICL